MKIYLALLLFFGAILNAKAQNYDPLTLSRKVLARDTFPNLKDYIADDYNGHPNGKDIKPSIKMSFELLNQNNQTAVVAVTFSDSTGFELNTYLHLKKEAVWKISAFRALALTGMIEGIYKGLSKLTPLQVDSVISSSHTKEPDIRMFKSKEEYQFLLGNSKLTLSSDKDLIAHFYKNKEQFEQLKNELINEGILNSGRNAKEMKDSVKISTQLKLLLIDNVYPNFDEIKGSLDFIIGGITDNAVGYFYIKNENDVPEMSPNHFIMIRSLGDGWYVYKTT